MSVDPLESQRFNNSLKISSTVKNQTEELTLTRLLLSELLFKEVSSEESKEMISVMFFSLMSPHLVLVLRPSEEL